MAVLGQGLVLMLAGMGIVFMFLYVLVLVCSLTKGVARFDSILGQDAPKKKPAVKTASDDADVALAIAIALG